MLILDRYQFLKGYGQKGNITVGFGSYGQVKLARDKKTGQNIAIKIVNKTTKNQIIFHQQLSHPNIIKLIDNFYDKQKQKTYMILQYADGGTLFERIQNDTLTKKQIKNYYRNICQAIQYMHENQIMHRDIKPQNILLTKKGKAKICDFGFAANLGQRKTLCGTYQYMAPQMIQNKPYDYKVDIWALGILLFQMISGKAPFKGTTPQEVLQQMKTKIFFNEKFTNQEINLIKSILRVTAHKRPAVKQILQNNYFYQQDTNSTKESQKIRGSNQTNNTNISNNTNTNNNISILSNKKIQNINQKQYTTNPISQNTNNNNKQKDINNININNKIQQNSYPFYSPKMNNSPPILSSKTQKNINLHNDSNINININNVNKFQKQKERQKQKIIYSEKIINQKLLDRTIQKIDIRGSDKPFQKNKQKDNRGSGSDKISIKDRGSDRKQDKIKQARGSDRRQQKISIARGSDKIQSQKIIQKQKQKHHQKQPIQKYLQKKPSQKQKQKSQKILQQSSRQQSQAQQILPPNLQYPPLSMPILQPNTQPQSSQIPYIPTPNSNLNLNLNYISQNIPANQIYQQNQIYNPLLNPIYTPNILNPNINSTTNTNIYQNTNQNKTLQGYQPPKSPNLYNNSYTAVNNNNIVNNNNNINNNLQGNYINQNQSYSYQNINVSKKN